MPKAEAQMPRMQLTSRFIDALKADSKQIDYWDRNLVGLSIRVTPKGRKVWTLMYRYHFRQRRLTLGVYPAVSLADARKKADVAFGQLAADIDPAASKDAARHSRTFGELVETYLAYIKPTKTRQARLRTWREIERLLNKDLLPALRLWKLADLRQRDIWAVIEPLTERKKGVIANHALSLLKTMCDFAVEHSLMEFNPCARIRQPVKVERRERFLSDIEIRALWFALDKKPQLISDILRTQLLTGQRIGEVMSMSWQDVDLSAGWWTIPAERAKNGHTHRVPLSQPASTILGRRKIASKSPWVFPAPKDAERFVQMPTLHKHVLALRPVVNFRTHDLRKTVATSLSQAGGSRVLLKRILNHRDREVTARYDLHSYDREAKNALETWGGRLDDIVKVDPGKTNVVAFGR
jgi:integrase